MSTQSTTMFVICERLMVGMASTANERLIFLDQVLGEQACNDIAHRDGKSTL